ncbi:hypothetical protein V8E36_006375 [Tilletia maclaganii]
MARPIRDLNRQPSNVSRHLMYIAWTGLIPAGIFVSPTPLAPEEQGDAPQSEETGEEQALNHNPAPASPSPSFVVIALAPSLALTRKPSSNKVASSPTLGRLQRLAQLVRGRQMHHAAVWRVPPAGGDDDEAESTPSGE